MRRARRAPIDWARLNHILLPEGRSERDRLRRSRVVRWLGAVYGIYDALTEEGRFTALLALLVAFTALDVRHSDAYVLFCVLAALVYASLAVSRTRTLRGVTLTATSPRRVTVGEPMSFSLRCENHGLATRYGLRVRGPFLPWDGKWLTPRPTIAELKARGAVSVAVSATFSRRGEHHLDGFTVAPLVPLGLAVGRSVASGSVPFLAVPRVANVVHIVVPLARRHQPGGVVLAPRSGESMDLLGVRPYRAGDLVRDLHARSWARTGAPVVREYQDEHLTRIGVVLDTDSDVADARSFEASLSLTAGVVAHLGRGEAVIDVLAVGERVHRLTAGRGHAVLDQVQDLLAVVDAAHRPDVGAIVDRLAPHVARLSSVVFVLLAWDDARRALVERVRALGVGCTALLVTPDSPSPGPRGAEPTRVGVDAIMAGARLSL